MAVFQNLYSSFCFVRLFNLPAIFSNTICVEKNHEDVNHQPEKGGEENYFERVPFRAGHIHVDHQVRLAVGSRVLRPNSLEFETQLSFLSLGHKSSFLDIHAVFLLLSPSLCILTAP